MTEEIQNEIKKARKVVSEIQKRPKSGRRYPKKMCKYFVPLMTQELPFQA